MRTEEKPMIARDESLRAAAASLHAAADALLAALSPAPSPAATPAAWVPKAYVPKVGDKVEFDAVFTDNKSGVVVAVDEARQVASIVRFGEAPSKPKWERYFYDVRLIGVANDIERINAGLPATSSERAAAGLPAEESATKPVDRVALAKVLYVARWPDENPAKLDADSQHLDGWLRTADAAIRFFKARGGAS